MMLTKPLLVVPAVPEDSGVKFILPGQEIMLDQEIAPTAWRILGLCNGTNTVDAIISALPDLKNEFIVGFLHDLNSLHIIADSRRLYEQFHAISSNPMAYTSDITEEEIVAHATSPRMAMKEGMTFSFSPPENSSLIGLQARRSSCRSFSSEPLSIDQIGGILDVGYSLARHAVPSAGNLYPMKLFVIALDDQVGMPAGYYEYDNEKNHLVLFNDRPDSQRIFHAFNDTGMPFGASVMIVIAADAYRQPRKYSNRGYRFMAIEAGEIAQNIVLGAVESGLATCLLGSMMDSVIVNELQMEDCLPFVAIALGMESSAKVDPSQLSLEQLEVEVLGDNKPVERTWLIDDAFSDSFEKSYFQFLARTQNGQITSGISTSWSDAELKAIAEGYERQQSMKAFHHVVSSASDLPSAWLDPRVIAPLTDEQFNQLPHLQKFDEKLKIEWIRGKDWQGREVFVPIDLIFYPIDNIDRKLVVDTCSSGFATYTNVGEAIRRGMLEIVERDALMRHWYEETSPRRLDCRILPIHIQNRVRYWQDRGREVAVLDISQHGVIAIEVVIAAETYPCFVSGASSTLGSFEEATIKAFQEAESRLIYGLNEPTLREIKPEQVHSVLDHELLYAQSKRYHEYVQFLFEGEVSHVIPTTTTSAQTLAEELELATVDVSEVNSLLRVVKVLSPKMIPISFGYRAGHHSHHTLARVANDRDIMPHYFA